MSKSENLENYKKSLRKQPIFNSEIARLVEEGLALLDAESDESSAPAKESPPSSTANAYERARKEVLAKFAPWRRTEVLQMEKTGNTENRHYQEFIKSVIELGNTYLPL